MPWSSRPVVLPSSPAWLICCLSRRRFVKFQNVTTLSIFIEDNKGEEDTTRVQKISLLGQPAEKMDVAAIKKVGEEEG